MADRVAGPVRECGGALSDLPRLGQGQGRLRSCVSAARGPWAGFALSGQGKGWLRSCTQPRIATAPRCANGTGARESASGQHSSINKTNPGIAPPAAWVAALAGEPAPALVLAEYICTYEVQRESPAGLCVLFPLQ